MFILGPWFIRKVTRLQFGQVVRDDGPQSHLKKQGTPSMGGVLIGLALTLSTLLWADLTNVLVWVSVLVFIGCALIGFTDDYLKISKKSSAGLSGRWKLLLQAIIIVGCAGLLVLHGEWDTRLSIPFFKEIRPDLGLLYAPFALLVIAGASNAVNLTDGLDGLAAGPIAITAAVYTIFAYVAGHVVLSGYLHLPYVAGAGELAIFCGAMMGASLGFLWYNAHPAEIFMGDVGSLSLGGALGAVAVLSKQEILLVIVGGVFVAEALSVMLQVGYFKLTGGKRIFRMAPIHHHFELMGWPETKVVIRFWIISVILGLIALSTLKLR